MEQCGSTLFSAVTVTGPLQELTSTKQILGFPVLPTPGKSQERRWHLPLSVLIMSVISREAHRGSGVCTHNLMHLCKNFSVCPATVNLNPLTSRGTCFIPNKMNSELFKRFNFARCPIQCRRSILSPDNRHLYWNINHVHSFWVALHTNYQQLLQHVEN